MKEIFVRLGATMKVTNKEYVQLSVGTLDSDVIRKKAINGEFYLGGDSYAIAENLNDLNFDMPETDIFTIREVETIQELTLNLFQPLYDKYCDEWGGCTAVEEKIRNMVGEFETYYHSVFDENTGEGEDYLTAIEKFCDQKMKEYKVGKYTEDYVEPKKAPDPHEVADVQARLDCEIAEWLEKNEIGNCAEWMERNYFLYDLAVEFTSDPEWNDPEKELNLCIREFCNHKKEELLQSKAKFKVGDWAYYFTSGNLEQVYIADMSWDSCDKEYRYGIGFGGAKYVDHDDIWEGELHKTPQDALEYLKERIERGEIIQYYK